MKKLTSLSTFSSFKISQDSSKLLLGGLTAPTNAPPAVSPTGPMGGCSSDEKTVTVVVYDNGSRVSTVTTEACC